MTHETLPQHGQITKTLGEWCDGSLKIATNLRRDVVLRMYLHRKWNIGSILRPPPSERRCGGGWLPFQVEGEGGAMLVWVDWWQPNEHMASPRTPGACQTLQSTASLRLRQRVGRRTGREDCTTSPPSHHTRKPSSASCPSPLPCSSTGPWTRSELAGNPVTQSSSTSAWRASESALCNVMASVRISTPSPLVAVCSTACGPSMGLPVQIAIWIAKPQKTCQLRAINLLKLMSLWVSNHTLCSF